MKPLVGVASPAFLFENEKTNLDIYRFSNNYGKRLYEAGGIPVGILPYDGRVPDGVLDTFDAFVICGGTQMWPHHFQVVEHALKHNKPLLGICLGMQTIHRYFKYKDWADAQGYTGDLFAFYQEHCSDPAYTTLVELDGHYKAMLRGRENEAKHRVNLEEGSHIAQLVGNDHLFAATVHHYCAFEPSSRLRVTGYAEDGTIEVIEYGEKVLGVQFHPEMDDTLMPLFSFLINK